MPGTARQMPFADYCGRCKANGFDGADVGPVTDENKQATDAAGLESGKSDPTSIGGLFGTAADAGKAVKASKEVMDAAAAHGVTRLFTVFVPPDPSKGRAANFARLKETFGPVVKYAEEKRVRIAVEGWPGGGPHYGALA